LRLLLAVTAPCLLAATTRAACQLMASTCITVSELSTNSMGRRPVFCWVPHLKMIVPPFGRLVAPVSALGASVGRTELLVLLLHQAAVRFEEALGEVLSLGGKVRLTCRPGNIIAWRQVIDFDDGGAEEEG
jgi:hypothetical protein